MRRVVRLSHLQYKSVLVLVVHHAKLRQYLHRLVLARRHDVFAVQAELHRCISRRAAAIQRLLKITSDCAPYTHRLVQVR